MSAGPNIGAAEEKKEVSVGKTADIAAIMKALPHRYPFLLLDRMEQIQFGESAVGIKNVTINEPFFPGHFPVAPVMPGVLIIEAMAQTAAALVMMGLEYERGNKIVYFMTVEGAKFRKPVGPGDQLHLEVKKDRQRGNVWRFKGVARVNGKSVAEASFSAMILDPPEK
ncbi:3-hydroxyacyl-ACP dehydratase FabZ [Acetobacteraceae bacterium]|nr:3-hydroxyacyl-ACP dehydratase FabZ [Acetobacteraceae bacterium]